MTWEEQAQEACASKARLMDAGAVKYSVKGKAGARVFVATYAKGWRFEYSEAAPSPTPRITKRPTDPKPKPKAKPKAKTEPVEV
jgi:hypothetical protein